jgi:hypothetical protein
MIVNLEEIIVSWRVLEVMGIKMVMVLRVIKQVESKGRVIVEAIVEI